MLSLSECTRDNLCVDCDDPNCLHAGSIEADCPLYNCVDRHHECESCEVIKKYQDFVRTVKGFDGMETEK